MEDTKRNRTFIFILAVFLFLGAFTAQTIYWFKVGKSGLAWTEHEGYKSEMHYTAKQKTFPFVKVRSCNEPEEETETEAAAASRANDDITKYGECDGS